MYTKFLPLPIDQYASVPFDGWPAEGAISDDRSAVVGWNGWCFIYEGGNSYRNGYLNFDQKNLGQLWARLIEQRAKACRAFGFDFYQVIVPNKLTILPEYFPEILNSEITFILAGLLEANPGAEIIVPIDQFRHSEVRHAVFRRNDSHLTLAGNAMLADIILKKMDVLKIQPATVTPKCVVHNGDLGSKFSTVAVEHVYVPDFSSGFLGSGDLVKVSETIVNGFNGTRQVFRNENAIIQKVLVVFGNSFFERTPSWGVSPFFASLFKSFHFIWAPEIDIAYCQAVSADVVIAQTCERFLPIIPDDKLKGS
jgi:hypothetical protein